MNIGANQSVKCIQIAVLTGIPAEEIKQGHVFPWGKGQFRVDSITGDDAQISRLASHEIKADEMSWKETPTQFEDSERFHELDFWESPNPLTEGPSGGFPPFNQPKTGPVSPPGLPADVKEPATMVVEKVDVLGPERKSPRPPARRLDPVGEPSPDDRIWSSTEALAARYGEDLGPDHERVLQAMALLGKVSKVSLDTVSALKIISARTSALIQAGEAGGNKLI